MSAGAATAQKEVCTTHQVRLILEEETGRKYCPVCEQLDNQNRLRRGRRR